MDEPIDFDEALRRSEGSERHLLLGNGFSCAYSSKFQYTSLYDSADFTGNDRLKNIFQECKTKDFESAIQSVEKDQNILMHCSNVDQHLINELDKYVKSARDILIKTIHKIHPQSYNMGDKEFGACRQFVKDFSKIFTLNYDLLLYLVLISADQWKIKSVDDGFRNAHNASGFPCVKLPSIQSLEAANLFYPHGGLHLFELNQETLKRKYNKSCSLTVLEQVPNAIMNGQLPLVVAEGESWQKQNKINSNAYLSKCQQVFKATCNDPNATLFTLGHSLSDNDEHYLSIIREGKIKQVYASIHRQDGRDDKQLRRRAGELEDARDDLTVTLFKADTANVWGKTGGADEHHHTSPAQEQQPQSFDISFLD